MLPQSLKVTLPAALFLAAPLALARPGTSQGLQSITAAEIKQHITYLASDALEGRGAGTEGSRKAGDYIVAELKRLGLKPGGDEGSFFQPFKSGSRDLRNIVAVLPGTDLASEYVVIGAHYDHVGRGAYGSLDMGASGKIHNGADDNSSGSTGVLEIAEAFVESGAKPRRSIVFMWFDGEELGLLGSRHYVANPIFPIKSTVAMLNMDMIGRLDGKPLTVYGVVTGGDLFKTTVDQANEAVKLELKVSDVMTSNSDHASFYGKDIPTVAFFTGLHKDYHRPSDDPDTIDTAGMEKIVRLGYGFASGIADADERPTFAKAKSGGMETMMQQLRGMFGDNFDPKKLFGEGGNRNLSELFRRFRGGQQGDKPRFGIRANPGAAEDGVIITEVSPFTVASRCGIKADDKIVEFNGQAITDFQGLVAAVRAAEGQVKVVVVRDGQRLELTADFSSDSEKPAEAPKAKKKAKLY